MGFLYRLDFNNGTSYIGVTTKTPKIRFVGHKASALKTASDCLVHKAWRKYGEPKLVVLAEVENCDLPDIERRAIQAFKTLSPFGYNMTPGGETSPASVPEIAAKIAIGRTGKTHSEQTKKRISFLKTGSVSPRKGKKHSEKSKAKMAASHKGLKQTDIHKARSSSSKAFVWAKKKGREFCELEIKRQK